MLGAFEAGLEGCERGKEKYMLALFLFLVSGLAERERGRTVRAAGEEEEHNEWAAGD